jgi:Ca2+-binding EF-hand superfamily protein
MDDDRNRTLNFDEFKKGIVEYGLGMSKDEITEIFKKFDTDNSGSIDFDEFLIKLRVSFVQLKIIL